MTYSLLRDGFIKYMEFRFQPDRQKFLTKAESFSFSQIFFSVPNYIKSFRMVSFLFSAEII